MEKKEIAYLKLHASKPTSVNFKSLQDWVVWQFPKKCAKSKGFCGAVHPPIEKYGWFPAVINPDKKEAHIFGHLSESFATPERAVEYFSNNDQDIGLRLT